MERGLSVIFVTKWRTCVGYSSGTNQGYHARGREKQCGASLTNRYTNGKQVDVAPIVLRR